MRLCNFAKIIVAGGAVVALAAVAEAGECKKLGAAGDGLTKSIAELMSTAGLKNVIEGKGMKGQGPVTTTCKAGTFLYECHSSQMACK